jgi:hypothetical protein
MQFYYLTLRTVGLSRHYIELFAFLYFGQVAAMVNKLRCIRRAALLRDVTSVTAGNPCKSDGRVFCDRVNGMSGASRPLLHIT